MNVPAANIDSSIKGRMERALGSAGNAEQLMLEIVAICGTDSNAAWEVLAQVDQNYRRGRISGDLYRTLKFQIQRMALGHPVAAPPRANQNAQPPAIVATPPVAPTQRAVATLLPRVGLVLRERYVLEEPIDYGTTDATYRAVDRYRADLADGAQHVAVRFPKLPAEAHREFFSAQALTHPNIVRVMEFDREGELAWYTLEYLQGKLLDDVLQELPSSPLPMPLALAIVREVGAALSYAHENQVVHGTLDSKSIMITTEGKVRVLNFGAHVHDALPPEPRDDLNALACLAYELFSGKHPFQGHGLIVARQLGIRARRPSQVNRRQWRALQQGLALSRKKKMLQLRDWLPRLELQRAASALPPLEELLSNRVSRGWSAFSIALVAGSVAVAGIAMLALIDPTGFRERSSAWRENASRIVDQAMHRAVRSPAPPAATTVPAPESTAPLEASQAAPTTVATPPRTSVARAPAAATAATGADAATGDAAAPEDQPVSVDPRPGNIGFLTDHFTVPQEAAAARVLVGRSSGQHGDVGFSWWTENGSARAGADYMSPGVQHAIIPDGQDSVSVFVPLVSAPRPPGLADFYVVLADPTDGASLGRITRLRVTVERQ